MKIVVFGANGRAGRRIVAEAARRDHPTTAVVRDPAAYLGPGGDRIRLAAGDITHADAVARLVAGADAVVSAVFSPQATQTLFPLAATILANTVRGRLVVVGIGTVLEVEPARPLHETPEFPEAGRLISKAHAEELAVLRAAPDSLDWLVIAPPPVLLDDEASAGAPYRTRVNALIGTEEPFSYADLASAVIDEIEQP